MKNALKETQLKLTNAYKQAKHLSQGPEYINKRKLLVSVLYESIEMMKCFFPGFMTVFSLVQILPLVASHIYFALCVAALILLFAEFVFILLSYIKFSKKAYSRKIKGLAFTINTEDYIVNMIDMLLEYKDQKNVKLLFAMGMNSTVLEKIKANPDSINKGHVVSVCHDFFEFAEEMVGIGAIKRMSEELCQTESIPQKGSVFMVDLAITGAKEPYSELNGSNFTVAFYVNSTSKDGEFGMGHEDVETGQATVFHLIENISDYIYREGKGNNKEFVLMIPAIGTGKSGKSPYRNVLIEIINCLSISGYCIPNKVVLSLRNLELFENNYEVSSLLRLSSQIMAHGKRK